ncbi:mobilization protein [Pedobacter mucosus]|uniref:mobilization protein n=1 Tax=Pedobacter mucosus TaxID=2895286 RepID=UPI001EE45DB4|nr:mobilization protein [Pedobacter mucosus]UKT64308.1 mobilization protein [Pedobacter mucosus]
MPRKKAKNQEMLFSPPIIIRVTEETFSKLDDIRTTSNCRSIGEVARNILTRKRILMLHRDISMNGPMEELASIRKELKAIGININQQTKYFHLSKSETEKTFHFIKTAELYKTIGAKVDCLLSIVSKLALKWLRSE